MKAKTIIEIIRAEIRESPLSLNELGRQTGIDPGALCRVKQGKILTTDSAQRLLDFFGYDIIKRKGVKP